ncbi:MAG: hypothetical protein M3Q30_13160 [Actinomycetota bacterium]|nr:hypothetical protein [Actinomycetota bacterium]
MTKNGRTHYQLIVYGGVDGQGQSQFVRETHHGPRRKAETRLAEMVAAVTRGQARPDQNRILQEVWDG